MGIRKYITLNLIALVALLDFVIYCVANEVFLKPYDIGTFLFGPSVYTVFPGKHILWPNIYNKFIIFILFLLFIVEFVIRKSYSINFKDFGIKNKVLDILHKTLFFLGLSYVIYLIISYAAISLLVLLGI